jgi:hypothetical protein
MKSGAAGLKVHPSRFPNTEVFEMYDIRQYLHRQRYLRPIKCMLQQCTSPQYLYAGATFLHPTTDVRRNGSRRPLSVHRAASHCLVFLRSLLNSVFCVLDLFATSNDNALTFNILIS